MEVTFAERSVDAGDGGRLAAAMRAEVSAMYGGLDLDAPDMPSAGPADFAPPAGRFIVGYDAGGTAVCCGGIKRLDEGACEIKRMYVVPEARGRGVGRALLSELERRAAALGYRIARLDTGPRQPRAQRMYLSAGYVRCANFNGNPVADFHAEKALSGAAGKRPL